MCAYGEGLLVGEELKDDAGRRAGGYVEVVRFEAEEEVAHAASCEVGLMTSGAEGQHDVVRCGVCRVVSE